MNAYEWYGELLKPWWAPPAWLFSPVWTVLYGIIAITFGTVFWSAWKKRIPWRTVIPFALNLVANAAFSPLQFILRSNELAAVDIVVVLITLVWAMARIAPYRRWIAIAQIPYLLWVSFATVLQLTITVLNYGR